MYRLFYLGEKLFETKNELEFYYFVTNHCRNQLHLDLQSINMEFKTNGEVVFYFNQNTNFYYVIDQTFKDPAYSTSIIERLRKEMIYFFKNNY